MNGKAMLKLLSDAGIRAQKVVRKLDTDTYIADFYVPEMKSDVPSARQWGEQIKQKFSDKVQITQLDDLRADWREGCPIIAATVSFIFRDKGDAS
jgi:hypothetical protein